MNQLFMNTWQNFKAALEANPQLILQFQYAEGKWVNPSYHITEIKQAPITSVDCGGKMNAWTEIIVQLWEPSIPESTRAMQVEKVLSIVNLVEQSLPLHQNGIVKIEFGNSSFDTRQMYPANFSIDQENLIINLVPDSTQCKAINRGGSCGTAETGEDCCAPALFTDKPTIQLKNLAVAPETCAPGSGCC